MLFESIGSVLPTTSHADQTTLDREKQLHALAQQYYFERPTRSLERLEKTHKMTVVQRLDAILDPGTPRFDLGLFTGDDETPQSGVYCVAGTISGLNVMVIANDNALHAGAWAIGTPEKIQRAQEAARRLRLPIVWLIECPGLYLPTQEMTFGGKTGAGGIFEHQIRHARAGLVQIAAVFGDCIAGGGYLPIFCDRVVMTQQASICIGGTALNRFSKAGSGKLGGPDIHVHETGCADECVPDDEAACRRIREWIALLPTSAVPFFRKAEPLPPQYAIDDLYALLPSDTKKPFDVRELVARLVDGSLVSEIDAESAPQIYACHALANGLPFILIANQPLHLGSVLTKECIEKMIRITQDAHTTGTPLVWIQDVSGFDIGEAAERDGLLRHGAALLHALTQEDDAAPHLTICLRKASGAGYYAMKGRPFDPALIAGTVLTRLEVMDATILANTMYDAKIKRAQAALDAIQTQHQEPNYPQSVDNPSADLSTPVENLKTAHETLTQLQKQKNALMEHQISESDVIQAVRRGDLDMAVPLRRLRELLLYFVNSSWQSLRPRQPR